MRKSSFVLAAVVLFTAACGSIGGLGDLGGILGSPSSTQASDVRGTVSSIDTAGRRIIMDVAYVNNLRNTQNAQSIYYDNNTRVEYQGQTYRVEDLERVLDARPVDQVIIALPIEEQPLVKALMEQLALRTVDVKVVPDLYQYITLCGGFEEFGGLPIINL